MDQKVNAVTAEVLMHHLQTLGQGLLDDVMLDYTDSSVLMSPDQTFYGQAQIRGFFLGALAAFPPEMLSAITILRQDIYEDVAYIVWKAEPFVKQGTDTFVIRDGKILAQTFLMTF